MHVSNIKHVSKYKFLLFYYTPPDPVCKDLRDFDAKEFAEALFTDDVLPETTSLSA